MSGIATELNMASAHLAKVTADLEAQEAFLVECDTARKLARRLQKEGAFAGLHVSLKDILELIDGAVYHPPEVNSAGWLT
jgi:hypothetical protein